MNILKSLVRKRLKKESKLKYAIALLHLWLGLLSSLVIFTVCLTGSIYAFKNQINDFYNRDKVYVESTGNRLSLDVIQEKFSKKNAEITAIIIPENNKKSYLVTFTDKDTKVSKTQYLNPYTGETLGGADHGLDQFFAVVLDIHRTMLVNQIGKQIVGISSLLFIFMLLSGLVLWWPKKWKHLKAGLTVKWNAKFHRLNYDIHNTLGFYALLFLMFMAITGLYVTYPWMKSGIIVSLGGNAVLTENAGEGANDEISNAFSDLLKDMMDKQDEMADLKEVKPVSMDSISGLAYKHLKYSATTIIQLPDEKDPRYRIKKINTDNWLGAQLPDEITFDKKGEVKTIERFADKPLNKQFVEISKPLHTGEILGLPSVILYFIVSLVGCSLPITGFIIWWKKVK